MGKYHWAEYKITTDKGDLTVKGRVLGEFGIHKLGEDEHKPNSHSAYAVTHIKTGMVVCRFLFLKTAMEFTSRLVMAHVPVSWDTTNIAALKKNGPVVHKLLVMAREETGKF